MADTIELEVATPARQVVRETVTDVEIPGKDGYLGILPGHAALLGLLGAGTLAYSTGGGKRYVAIQGGFVEVSEDHVRVLADIAEPAGEIDAARAQADLVRAQAEAAGADPEAALKAAALAQARIETARRA
ncbi:MAG TPA: ATP synthase F1 subunit epsilon [Bryobacteraceae bacterium]|nr:ATP synthase F1 subunit epsilon [Bryobacteraceae bacterium]